jgi:hypothetical protein
MGEGLSAHLTKGVVNRKVDALVNARDDAGRFHKRAEFLAAVKAAADAQQYLAVLRQQAGVSVAESTYLRDKWYEEGPTGLWPALQPVYLVLVRGLITAIEKASDDLPVDTYWIPVGDRVEVLVARSARQVTRIILTPPVEAATTARTEASEMWIVEPGTGDEKPGDATVDTVVEAVDGAVVTRQIRELKAQP